MSGLESRPTAEDQKPHPWAKAADTIGTVVLVVIFAVIGALTLIT